MMIILIIIIKIILIGGLYRLLLHMSVLSLGPGSTTLLSVREEIKHIDHGGMFAVDTEFK